MATQTPVQRQAAAKRAAATRKRNAAQRSAAATKSSASRTVLIPLGALAAAGDAVRRIARTYASSGRRARQLDRFERRGAKALDRGRRTVARRAR
jgi:hypothetical protein